MRQSLMESYLVKKNCGQENENYDTRSMKRNAKCASA